VRFKAYCIYLVPTARIELAQLSPPPPQDGVSTNSTTSASKLTIYDNQTSIIPVSF
jgi:hypothetical protein